MKRRGQTYNKTLILSAALAAAAGVSIAQDDPGGLRFVYDVGLGVSVTDNEGLTDPGEGVTTRLTTDLTFGIESQTRTSSLDARITFDGEYLNDPVTGDEFDIGSPVGSIRYTREAANSRFSFGATYSRDRLNELLTFLDEDFNPVDLIFDRGSIQRLTANADLAFGIEGPVGLTFGARYDDRDYIDTTDPDLFDRRTLTLSAGLRLQFSDVATGRLSVRATRYEDDDTLPTERDTYTLGAGVDYLVDPLTRISVDLNFTQIEESLAGFELPTVDAVGFGVSAVRTLPNGTLDASLSRNVGTDGTTRDSVSIGRDMDLPRGALSFGIGYSTSDTGEDAVIADLALRRDLPDGSLSATLSRSVTQNDDDEETLITRLSLGYSREINSASGVSVSFGLGQSENLTTVGGGTTTRANVDLVYTRDFVADLDWSVGYRARYLDEPGSSSRVSNTVFTRIDRRFSIRP